jgi:hypothetical protein
MAPVLSLDLTFLAAGLYRLGLKILIILHIKPHTKEEGLQPTDEGKDERHGINIRNISGNGPDIKEADRQRNAAEQKNAGKYIEKNQWMKILDDVFEK